MPLRTTIALALCVSLASTSTIIAKRPVLVARPRQAPPSDLVLSLRGGASTVPAACRYYTWAPVFIGMVFGLLGFITNTVPEVMPVDQGTMVNQKGKTVTNPNVRTWGIRNSLPAAIHLWALLVDTNTAYQASFLAATWRETGDCILKFFFEKDYALVSKCASKCTATGPIHSRALGSPNVMVTSILCLLSGRLFPAFPLLRHRRPVLLVPVSLRARASRQWL